jgi:hypothetical protein
MNIVTTNFTLAQLCDHFDKKDLRVNKDYQRSDEVWPDFARSLLVETALLGYPMPKLTIRQSTDMKSLKTYQEIVDGQQRTRALVDFFHGEYELSNTLETAEFRGKSIHTLDELYRERFVTYSVGADVLVGASDIEVIEVFRRMNSYTAPLNPEEQRHATYQGAFKWFVYEMRRACESTFSDMGVFKQKSFVRMQDAKLITELTHAVLNGIVTTNKKYLDGVYAKYNREFEEGPTLRQEFEAALAFIKAVDVVAKSPLVKPYNFYALMLAVVQIHNPRTVLDAHLDGLRGDLADLKTVSKNLAILSEALEDPENPPEAYKAFVAAASEKTNVKAQRVARLKWFYKALTDQLG